MAVRLDWRINVIGDVFIISVGIISVILVSMRKRIGLMLGMIPALWAILFQWFLVYILSGYEEPLSSKLAGSEIFTNLFD